MSIPSTLHDAPPRCREWQIQQGVERKKALHNAQLWPHWSQSACRHSVSSHTVTLLCAPLFEPAQLCRGSTVSYFGGQVLAPQWFVQQGDCLTVEQGYSAATPPRLSTTESPLAPALLLIQRFDWPLWAKRQISAARGACKKSAMMMDCSDLSRRVWWEEPEMEMMMEENEG